MDRAPINPLRATRLPWYSHKLESGGALRLADARWRRGDRVSGRHQAARGPLIWGNRHAHSPQPSFRQARSGDGGRRFGRRSLAGESNPVYVKQGKAWTAAARADFYSRDQGSRIIPLAWLRALKTAGGQPFLHDGLARYGYLPNPGSRSNLPVGFMAAGPAGRQDAAMTCSACHTRQIAVGGIEYRIDGGPAIVDFQAFLADLDAAVGRVLASDAAFAAFAAEVPGAGPEPRGRRSPPGTGASMR